MNLTDDTSNSHVLPSSSLTVSPLTKSGATGADGLQSSTLAPAVEGQEQLKFCVSLPNQPKMWSASSLKTYMLCPRRHQYQTVMGLEPAGQSQLDLEFGTKYHQCLENFDTLLLQGLSVSKATERTFHLALDLTELDYGASAGSFWGGRYLEAWRCSGVRKKPRCEHSKKWHFETRPTELCGACGSELRSEIVWVPDNKHKNRETLLRTVLEYMDSQPQDGSLRPYRFPNGQDGLELQFAVPLPLTSPDGDPYILRGYFDSFFQFGNEVAPRERKTTKAGLGKFYWDRYEPDVQVDTYDLVVHALFPEMHSPGVLMEAAQTGVNFSKVERRFVTVPAGRREEWFNDLQYWISRAEADARANYFPKNTASCQTGGGCPFRDVCRRSPDNRGLVLERAFQTKAARP
jgi:hypothetical protein